MPSRMVLALAAWVLAVAPAAADQITGYVEVESNDFESRTETPGNPEPARLEAVTLIQRFRVDVQKSLFPNLNLRLGGLFERSANSTESGGTKSETTTTRLRPFFDARLQTRATLASFTYTRSEDEVDVEGRRPSTDVRESFAATLAWDPEDLPRVRLQFFRTNSFDKARLFRDSTQDRYELSTDYRPLPGTRISYQGTLLETQNLFSGNETRDVTHNGRLRHSAWFWDRRVSFSSDYSVAYRKTETRATGPGDVDFALLAFAGAAALDDTPEEGPLDDNPALIDGSLAAGAGVNLGLPPPGGDVRPRNLRLDFSSDTEVNLLFVWVDRDLPPEVSGSFSWDIYTSDNDRDWVRRQTVPPAPFDRFLTRFEIRFANVTTRYLKIVTRPLGPTVPNASDFPIILVTEMQGLVRRPAEEARGEQDSITQNYSVALRARILDAPSVFYELNYSGRTTEGLPSRYLLSNGISASHRFNAAYSGAARVAREEGRTSSGDLGALVYTASLTVRTIETLQQSLVVSGRNEDIDDTSRDTVSVFLYNLADLYEGISLNVGVGKSYAVETDRGRIESTQINATTTLVPHRTMTVNLSYQDRRDDGPAVGTADLRTGEVSVAYSPTSTLYFFGSHRIEDRADQDGQTIDNWAVNWSPFPKGTLRLSLSYNEIVRSEGDAKDRIFSPSVRWNITPRSYLNVGYQKISSQGVFQAVDNNVLSGTLRFSF